MMKRVVTHVISAGNAKLIRRPALWIMHDPRLLGCYLQTQKSVEALTSLGASKIYRPTSLPVNSPQPPNLVDPCSPLLWDLSHPSRFSIISFPLSIIFFAWHELLKYWQKMRWEHESVCKKGAHKITGVLRHGVINILDPQISCPVAQHMLQSYALVFPTTLK